MPIAETTIHAPTPRQLASSRKWAGIYRDLGYQPLPSRMDKKQPMVKFADHWDTFHPNADMLSFFTSNIQIMSGRAWGLLVIDLDGPEAIEAWKHLGYPRKPRTWVTNSGGGGEHWWFTIPKHGDPIPKAILWKGDGPHQAIERLCDRSLVMAPPSIHPTTGKTYRFRSEPESPVKLTRPANCPGWLLQLPALAPPPIVSTFTPPKYDASLNGRRYSATGRFDREDVLHSIGDKAALAKCWGLRIASERASAKGWISCHAIEREDKTPSCGFNIESGHYVDHVSGRKLSFFDLSIALGKFADWKESLYALGSEYCPQLKSQPEQRRARQEA